MKNGIKIDKSEQDLHIRNTRSAVLVRLADGIEVGITKPKVVTRFCCGENDRGQGDDAYGSIAWAHRVLDGYKTEQGFMAANVGEFDKDAVSRFGRRAWHNARTVERGGWVSAYNAVPALVDCDGFCCVDTYSANPETPKCDYRRVVRILTDDDMRRMRHGYMVVRADFKKRVRAYWKRYGASEIKTWTYWTEA